MGKQAFDKKLEAVDALRESRDPALIRKALKDRNNFLVSKAVAAIASRDLVPDLVEAFDRFMIDPAKSDPKCWAKIAIAKKLKELEADQTDLFLRGLRHVQMEPAYARSEDTAVTLRGTCAMALVACPLPRYEILKHLVDALGSDRDRTVRSDAVRAIAQVPGPDSLLILRLKAQSQDDPEVIGQCFVSLLEISAAEYIPFVAGFLHGDLAMEAIAALGECHDPEAARVLIKNYQTNLSRHPDFKRAILLSLGASRHSEAAEFLLSVCENGRENEAVLAIQALAAGRFRDEYKDRVREAIDEPKLIETFKKNFS